MIPLITREISFGVNVSELVFGVDLFDLDFWCTQKMIPVIKCEVDLGQYVSELAFCVNVFGFDSRVQIDSIEQPKKEQLCGFWKHVSLSGFFPL